ncbi:MAG: TIGR00153 family protein [Xanthomonadaceae bacterium]|nr:TIGR00153 family protein [Xanthomonadaceae bacterium]
MADYLSKIFGASPVRPMQEHMERAVESVAQLVLFIEAAASGDWEAAEKLQQGIGRIENDADDRKRNLRLNLPSTLLLPVDRHDLLELLTTQDKIANRAKDIAGLMTGRRMQIPDRLAIGMLAFVNRCHDATLQAQRVVMELDELFETGFRGAEARLVRSMIEELDRIEGDTDDLQRQLRAVLFELENELPPVEVIFLYKIIEWVGDLADQAQRVGSRLHLILAR